MSSELPALNSREVQKALRSLGYVEDRQSGSHRVFVKEGERFHVTVPIHGNISITKGTLKNIIRQTGVTQEVFVELARA